MPSYQRPSNPAQWMEQRDAAFARRRRQSWGVGGFLALFIPVWTLSMTMQPVTDPLSERWVIGWVIGVISISLAGLGIAMSALDDRPEALLPAEISAGDLAGMERWKAQADLSVLMQQVKASQVPLLHQDLLILRRLIQQHDLAAHQAQAASLIAQA